MNVWEWLTARGIGAWGELTRHMGLSLFGAMILALAWKIWLPWAMARYAGAFCMLMFGLGYEAGGNRSLRDLCFDVLGIAIMLFFCGGFGII